MLATVIKLRRRGNCDVRFPNDRKSWECLKWEIRAPAQMNRRALNRAWVSRWKRARLGRLRPRLAIITPSCLRVERAMIFFMSFSAIADNPAMSIVKEAVMRIRGLKSLNLLREGKKRMRRNTPAVTRVEEWTRAETGVGAAMAAGSQEENGICALLVMAAIVREANRSEERLVLLCVLRASQLPWLKDQAILRRIRTSPMRLVRTVIIPAAKDFGFW